ncbi:MAG: hypothetical protein Q7R96_03295, partial [Nanoarchaeota archaeon]|nr:hypothetical protein [Nanoarchaeota archaeon]
MTLTFEQAKEVEALRQPYCDQFLAEHPHPFVERVVYDPSRALYKLWVDDLFARGFLNKRAYAEAMNDIEFSSVPEMFVPWTNIEQMGNGGKIP